MAKTQTVGVIRYRKMPVCKRTSIGGRFAPKNKQARRRFKPYRGQGRPR